MMMMMMMVNAVMFKIYALQCTVRVCVKERENQEGEREVRKESAHFVLLLLFILKYFSELSHSFRVGNGTPLASSIAFRRVKASM